MRLHLIAVSLSCVRAKIVLRLLVSLYFRKPQNATCYLAIQTQSQDMIRIVDQFSFRSLRKLFSRQQENIQAQLNSNSMSCTYQVSFIFQCYTEPSRSIQRISDLVTRNKPGVMPLSIYCSDSEWRREINLNELDSCVGSRGAPSFSASNLCHVRLV